MNIFQKKFISKNIQQQVIWDKGNSILIRIRTPFLVEVLKSSDCYS